MIGSKWAVLAGASVWVLASGGEARAAVAASPAPGLVTEQALAPSHYSDWPRITSARAVDRHLDAQVHDIVAQMSLAQKIGQMTQAEIKSITPEQVRQYYIGSVLNGGGSWPQGNKHASAADWLALADRYYDASMAVDAPVKLPIIWGTDAVHGHSNVFGATLFPHNVGLGAAHDPELIRQIGAATARAVRATGVDWAFAPTLAVAQNTRWGRTYESFSNYGPLVRVYARAYIDGLQGHFGDANVMATAKHFIGDGATANGTDQGDAKVSRLEMINVHGSGYVGALETGVLSVMASYNSWDDAVDGVNYGKMSGARALLTGALKDKMGFPGFIVSDWNAIGQLPGCSNASCPQAINAGIDMVMVPDDWRAFIANTTHQVQGGEIPMSRIDDAVSRIVRAKLVLGEFGKRPSQRVGAGDASRLQDRALARRAVRESLVLLKNNHDVLPFKRGTKVLVVGKSADTIANQVGGWSLTWQGTDNSNADFPNATSVLAGIRAVDGSANVTYRATTDGVDLKAFDAIIAVIGETPYAETMGDIIPSATLRHSDRHPEDLAVLKAAAASGKPVVTVFLSGRPLFVNDLLNASDAFVAAWLPGSEGEGIADLLFASEHGMPAFNFSGTLAMPWPGVPCPYADGGKAANWLFARGQGLHYPSHHDLPMLPTHADVGTCASTSTLPIFHTLAQSPFALYLGAGSSGHDVHPVGADLNAAIEWPANHPLFSLRTVQVNTQQDAKLVSWHGPGRFFMQSPQPTNLMPLVATHAALQFDVVIETPAQSPVAIYMGCGDGCTRALDVSGIFAAYERGKRHAVSIPLQCFVKPGADLAHIDVPFGVLASTPYSAAFANVRIAAEAGSAANAACPETAAQ
ncbi:glycoside hydrolase family 3 N-terminal domain-containing protein [Rhodanobacter sp. AS-Z3]|uniref:glycoside hydrolase family 3 protein n=1 Tax=Rhodanobacter sp. AS-Z3 TaxID=3031330 RepID=UPI00247921B2|nr:glycoside hydrolase family 3 N-terminal domain-containing protein [Rhodanobacter sp. AS-Z3]WEN14258.1 glycoside hydrolase family 3 N-terminal domain-containing protein [Rhodanobacter sp. AS-Z3]